MNIIIDTDIGRDPDDFFTILYFVMAGVNIKAVCVSPGDKDQIAIVAFLRDELGLNFPIAGGRLNRDGKKSSGGLHYKILNKYGYPLEHDSDGFGVDVIRETLDKDKCDLFICGPTHSVGGFLAEDNRPIERATMQGGFLPYDLHSFPCERLGKFEGKKTVATFNLNGCVKGGLAFANATNIKRKQFIGKNICHTVIYNKEIHEIVLSHGTTGMDGVKKKAKEIFIEAMSMYLKKHSEKKFHDPTAAVCHLHPEVADWVSGTVFREKGKWGTRLKGNDQIAAHIDYFELWKHIIAGE
jgi:pyrimidine-specific ribonucleoside hydrolase